MVRKAQPPPAIEPRIFRSLEEILAGIAKLQRRVQELDQLDIAEAVRTDNGADRVVTSNIRESIREVFGSSSPEFKEHEHIRLWAGPMFMNMSDHAVVDAKLRGRTMVKGILNGLIARL